MMTKARLLRELKALPDKHGHDGEASHSEADALLLDYLSDPEITAAYQASNPGWCA